MHPPASLEIGAQVITLMAALMLVLQLLLIAERMLLTSIRLFAMQSLLLAAIAAVVAYFHHAGHVYFIALLTVENGVMLAAVALTTYGMPLVVELGIFFDVMVAVMVLGILVYRIRETFASMDTSKLNQLKG